METKSRIEKTMKNTLLLLLLILTVNLGAQTVRIDFISGCPEEFDVFFKKGFESIGYNVFINYHGRSENRVYDQLFTYEWKDNVLKISLIDKSGSLLKNGEKKFTYLDEIENQIYLFLSDLMNRRINVKDYRGKIKGLRLNAMVKLDSAVYVVQAHNNDSAMAVRNFLLIAKELTGNFMTYYDFSYYQVTYYEVGVLMTHNASKLFGIVIGKSKDGTDFDILTEPPDIFKSYLEDILKNNPLPGVFPDGNSMSPVYILRSTGFVGSFVPFSIFVDDRFVCYLKNEEYLLLYLKPGWHTFAVQNSSKETKSWTSTYNLSVVSGQKAFIKLIQHTDFTFQIIYQLEKEYSARILLQNMVKSKCLLD
jgi:hypothetical protein